MFTKAIFALLFLAALVLPVATSAAPDTIKGDWTGVFSIAGHQADVKLTFDIHRSAVTGTMYSEHTGPGTITEGKYQKGKITCILKFEKHESIKLWGDLKDGQLTGEFATEGRTGTWSASRAR